MRCGVAFVVTGVASACFAEPIPIQNHSFEANFAAPNHFPVLVPDGWQAVDPAGILDFNSDALGVLNPTGGTFFPAGAPDGENVALVYISGDIGTGPVGLRQPLAAALNAGTRYTLTVEVGDIASGFGPPGFGFFDLDGFPGYTVQLLAGGEVVAEDFNSLAAVLDEGEFATSIVTLAVEASHPRVGQPLEIRLLNLNVAETLANPGIEVDFDNVRLDASPVCALEGDLDGGGVVDLSDLATLLANFGRASGATTGEGDVDGDGDVDLSDLAALLANFGESCP